MTETISKKPAPKAQPKRILLQAKQPLLSAVTQSLIQENEVYLHIGDDLPAEHIAVPASKGFKVGQFVPVEDPLLDPITGKAKAPTWTTPGFKDGAIRRQMSDDELGDTD